MLRGNKVNLHMTINESLDRQSPRFDAKAGPNLFLYDYLTLATYFVDHCMPSNVLVRLMLSAGV